MYLIRKVMVITCLWNPKSLEEFKIKNLNLKFQVLYNVDQLGQLVIFENLLESNKTLLSKDNFFLII
jgi:hypothetical protein